jgi:hypothetical protein
MSKQKQGGGQSKQSAPEGGAKGGAQDARNVKDAKDPNAAGKVGGKGGGAKQKRKH